MAPGIRRWLRGVSWLALALALGALYLAWRGAQTASVIVEWSTASEMDVAGFNLYRSEEETGDYEKINLQLIPPAIDPLTGGEYTYTDHEVLPGRTYFYQLEDVELSGGTNRYGVISVTAQRGGGNELALAVALAGVAAVGLLLLPVRVEARTG